MKISTDVGKNTVHKLGWESSIKQCWGPWESNAPDFKVSNFNRPFLRKILATTSFRTNTSEKTNTSEQWAFDLWPDSAERNNSLNVCFSTDVCKKLTNCIAHTSSTVLAVPLLILTRLAPRGVVGHQGAVPFTSQNISSHFSEVVHSIHWSPPQTGLHVERTSKWSGTQEWSAARKASKAARKKWNCDVTKTLESVGG